VLEGSPYFHELQARYPHSLLTACGKEVGLPLGVMGNSEVGHMNLGAGRVVYQDISRIDQSIEDGSFASNGALRECMERALREGKKLHLMGLVSNGGVHASDQHVVALLEMAAKVGLPAERVLIHAITDGRDTSPRSSVEFLSALEHAIEQAGVGRIASVIGRYWAMDRDKRWDRTQRAYELLLNRLGERFGSSVDAVLASYAKDTGDEFVEPSVIGDADSGRLENGDGLIVFNFRSDRLRQICEALEFASFDGFERGRRVHLHIVTMTQYREDFPFPVAFAPQNLEELFPDIIAKAGLRQARIAETEKYAHVTFFFSGGREALLPGEERILLPSPKVATYDLQPEMSAQGVTDAVLKKLADGDTNVFIINFANADMVGHSGIYSAALKAVRTIDHCLQQIVPKVIEMGGTVAITADHGNAEQLWDETTNQPHTAHTLNLVPFVLCGKDFEGQSLRKSGILADVAPTLLEILGLPASTPMNGHSLLG
ncbi:MAG TPA: 2,3-bisphosphoglycerate-independent phosphoglycerate mutase, partial [Planctomycetota bacterium]|nr:2,3-bisphosphoglycerate-independent phosphoglycerate mutase [Planctomycetota bacterium]